MKKVFFKNISSLEKILPKPVLSAPEYNSASCLLDEEFSYQLAFIGGRDMLHCAVRMEVSVNSDIADCVELFDVKYVPVILPAYFDLCDEDYLIHSDGVLPDILEKNDGTMFVSPYHYKALWVSVKTNRNTPSGVHKIEILFKDDEGDVCCRSVFELNIIAAELPKQRLINTQWLHCDCISTYYKLEPLSEEHWEYIERFVAMASEHGINMMLTPVFTPPLDTQIGAERPTVQLIDAEYENGVYAFNFDKLQRWLDMCRRNNIEYIEISHLFTQWGAEHAPKIVVRQGNELVKKFGWHTDSLSEEYIDFLNQLMPKLTAFLREKWGAEKVYFHLSDEPKKDHIERYGKLHKVMKPLIEGFGHFDALSDLEFYQMGYVDTPVVATTTIDGFIEAKAKNLWAYYCCGMGKLNLSNRFVAMPSYRNRIMGVQLYKYAIQGFLQWGYNFYYSFLSSRPINPFCETDSDGRFPAGDAYSVYPGCDGPMPSIRLKVFADAIRDLRALEMLEGLVGREKVMELVEKEAEITFKDYPHSAEYILNLRGKVNALIAEATASPPSK